MTIVVRDVGTAPWASALRRHPMQCARVAAIIVDLTALNRLSDEVGRLSDAEVSLTEIGEQLVRTYGHMAIELDRIREELRI